MIDNVILLITGTLHQRSIAELVPKCHPLGSFEQMEAVNIAQTPAELYNAILVDTPLGKIRGRQLSNGAQPWMGGKNGGLGKVESLWKTSGLPGEGGLFLPHKAVTAAGLSRVSLLLLTLFLLFQPPFSRTAYLSRTWMR